MNLNLERLKELAIYWYFYFPKWMWMVVLFVLFILINAAAATWFPVFDDWQSEGKTTWTYRLVTFYFAIVMIGAAGVFMALIIVPFVQWLYQLLPDDPRKQKESKP